MSELLALQEISKLEMEIKSLESQILSLRVKVEEKRKSIKHIKKISELDNIRAPFLLRDIYVFTYYWRGVYACQHAIFYGIPREPEYKDAISKLSPDPTARKMKIPTSNYNVVCPIKVSYSCIGYSKTLEPIYEWNEPLRKDDAPTLSSIDKSVIYLIGDHNDKSDYEIILGVFTDPKKLASELMNWSNNWSNKVYSPYVNLYLVQGNESCVLMYSKSHSFNPRDYPEEYIPTIIAAKTQELLSS